MTKKKSKKVKTSKIAKIEETKNPGGRPTKYLPEYCDLLLNYFDVNPCNFKDVTTTSKDGTIKETTIEEANMLPTFRRFAKTIGVYHDTLLEWCKHYPCFSAAYNRAKESQNEFVVENALRENYSGYFAGLMMKNVFSWRDKNEHEHTGKDGGPIKNENVNMNMDILSTDELKKLAAVANDEPKG